MISLSRISAYTEDTLGSLSTVCDAQNREREARLLNVLEGLRAGPTRVKVEALGDWMEGRVTEL